MTAGTNHHAMHPRDDRESLSALFDGELPGDAARFALKRLDHDVGWRETCGRWQLIGDALRGEATAVAPPYFAAGVMGAIRSDAPAQAVSGIESATGDGSRALSTPRRRWIGGAALAASVAMAAVLVVGPYSQDASPVPDAQVAASATPAATSPAPTPSATARVPESAIAATDRDEAPLADDAVKPGRADDIGSGRAQAVASADRIPAHATRRGRAQAAPVDMPPVDRPLDSPATTVAVAAPAATTRQPFHPPTDEITIRPWPRAVLPGTAAEGSLTVGYGSSSTASPSFYPFEPRLPASDVRPAADASSTDEPQR